MEAECYNFTTSELRRLTCYREAIKNGFYTDKIENSDETENLEADKEYIIGGHTEFIERESEETGASLTSGASVPSSNDLGRDSMSPPPEKTS